MALNANEQLLDQYLRDVLGIQSDLVRGALRNQGLSTIDEFVSLSEEDIEDVCKIIRRPGGTVPNPAYLAAQLPPIVAPPVPPLAPIVAPAAPAAPRGRGRQPAAPVQAGAMGPPAPVVPVVQQALPGPVIPPTIPNPGIPIGHLHEKRLKMLRYYTFHLQRIQRLFDPVDATMQILQEIYLLKDVDEEDIKVDLPAKLVKTDKVREIIENIESVLLRMRGINGVPLLYVVRDQVALPTNIGDDLDPGFGLPNYSQEMIRRAPHNGVYFREAQKSVWNVIRHVTHGGPGWNWVQSFASTQDGRNAFLTMKRYYLGESYTRRIKISADNVLVA
jgi:hypothetical protein